MNTKEIIELLKEVKLYDKGSHVMWTDPYIAKLLLQAHIDPDNDGASRKATSVKETINFIMDILPEGSRDMLDLGCGPGLYTTQFAMKGLTVSGYDFSQNSIAYAVDQSQSKELDIHYKCMNYLDMDCAKAFDVIIMIYCDFGVLSVTERNQLIAKIYKALKPGGIFIFDTLNQKAINKLGFDKSWEVSQGGFWQENPYTCLSERLHFPESRAILDQHIVIDESNSYKLYRFWNHYFSHENVNEMFEKHNFATVEGFEDILSEDEGVTFYKVQK